MEPDSASQALCCTSMLGQMVQTTVAGLHLTQSDIFILPDMHVSLLGVSAGPAVDRQNMINALAIQMTSSRLAESPTKPTQVTSSLGWFCGSSCISIFLSGLLLDMHHSALILIVNYCITQCKLLATYQMLQHTLWGCWYTTQCLDIEQACGSNKQYATVAFESESLSH